MLCLGDREVKDEEKVNAVKLKKPRKGQSKRKVTCTDCGLQLHWTSLARHRKKHQPREELFGNVVNNRKGEEGPEESVVMEVAQMKQELDEEEEKNVKSNLGGLCEYELIRLENIRQREALFAELNLDAAKVEARPRIERRTGASSKGVLQTEKREKEVLPTRASSRLACGSVKEIVNEIVEEIIKEVGKCDPVQETEVQRAPETGGGLNSHKPILALTLCSQV